MTGAVSGIEKHERWLRDPADLEHTLTVIAEAMEEFLADMHLGYADISEAPDLIQETRFRARHSLAAYEKKKESK